MNEENKDREQLTHELAALHRRVAELEEQLRQAQKMEAIGHLTSGIAHNFNNMLQIILSNTELSLLTLPKDPSSFLGNALETIDRAVEMVDQLMVFSRQNIVSEYQPIQMETVLHKTVDICRATFDRKIDIQLEVDTAPPVLGNLTQLEQVFLNLCLNARDALETQTGPGVVRIGVDQVFVSPEDQRF
jgi:signal transduction histidine kinase